MVLGRAAAARQRLNAEFAAATVRLQPWTNADSIWQALGHAAPRSWPLLDARHDRGSTLGHRGGAVAICRSSRLMRLDEGRILGDRQCKKPDDLCTQRFSLVAYEGHKS